MYQYKATITDVYDGDSVTAIVDLGFKIFTKLKIRLAGINTPEIKGEDREAGLVSKDRLTELILNKEVIIKTSKDKQEKYGRWLAEIYLPEQEQSVNQLLITEGLAVPYLD